MSKEIQLQKFTNLLQIARELNPVSEAPKNILKKATLPPRKLLSRDEFESTLQEYKVPQEVIEKIELVNIEFRGFDNKIHQGQIAVHKKLKHSIKKIFMRIKNETDFPFSSVDLMDRFDWNDHTSIAHNNTSGFNWRFVFGTMEISDHAVGGAIDINSYLNPWVKDGIITRPYNPKAPGTLHASSVVVQIFKDEGWSWGGDWKKSKDWQHFYRPDIPYEEFGKAETAE